MTAKPATALVRNSGACARLKKLAEKHPCAQHGFFDFLRNENLDKRQIAALLRNYDAHASVLRRLLLHAATLMPEAVLPFVLENLRNEYGNGNYADNHQSQLRGLAFECGVSLSEFRQTRIERGVKNFIKEATRYYRPERGKPEKMKAAAIAAGAINATELLAVKEFACMQKAFSRQGREQHVWFRHVLVELEHADESLALALYFAETAEGLAAVEYGLKGVLDANVWLYDGLLAAMTRTSREK